MSKNCSDQDQKFYVGEVLHAAVLIKNQVTGARVDTGTLPTVTTKNLSSMTTGTGTSEWVPGGSGDDPTARVYFTPSEAGLWEVEVRTSVPFVGIERFQVSVL
jgi:hypothetical protein